MAFLAQTEIPVVMLAPPCHFTEMRAELRATVRTEWRGKPFDPSPWQPTKEERPGGESQGFWVTRNTLRGYLKPSKADAADIASHPRAAHEKIAADLAFDLGLPVSPAILVDGTACGGLVEAAVVSAVIYSEIYKWEQVAATAPSLSIGCHILRSTRAGWSGVLALDAWLGNSDRNNAGNLLIGVDPDLETPVSEAVFCDYSNSMMHSQWAKNAAPPVVFPNILPVMRDFFDRSAALATAERIRGFAADSVAEIVNRIPETHLDPSHRDIITSALIKRSAEVPDVIAAATN